MPTGSVPHLPWTPMLPPTQRPCSAAQASGPCAAQAPQAPFTPALPSAPPASLPALLSYPSAPSLVSPASLRPPKTSVKDWDPQTNCVLGLSAGRRVHLCRPHSGRRGWFHFLPRLPGSLQW